MASSDFSSLGEPYDETQDAVYQITNISVTSPDDVATQFSSRTDEAKGGREEQLRLRIGDPDRTISAPTATYVISYDLAGAMRTSGSYDEFYWDATGLDWTASIKQVAVSVTVPAAFRTRPAPMARSTAPSSVRPRSLTARPSTPRATSPGGRHGQRQDQGRLDRRQQAAPRTGRLEAVLNGRGAARLPLVRLPSSSP